MHRHLLRAAIIVIGPPIHRRVMLVIYHGIDHHCGLRFDDHLASPLFLILPSLLRRLSCCLARDNLVDLDEIESILLIKADIAVAHQVYFKVLLTLEVIWQEHH